MKHRQPSVLVLAIHPMTNGFGYVLMTSPLAPVDFGIKSVRRKEKNAKCLEAIAALIETHHPEAIVLEDPTAPGSQRQPRIRRLVRAIAQYAQDQVLDVSVLSRDTVRECFESFAARTRRDIAISIAQRIPAFERFLPRPRMTGNSEHSNMSIFAAAALALTYFHVWSR
jgi:hypothetical protein